jgi:hypothetical protein
LKESGATYCVSYIALVQNIKVEPRSRPLGMAAAVTRKVCLVTLRSWTADCHWGVHSGRCILHGFPQCWLETVTILTTVLIGLQTVTEGKERTFHLGQKPKATLNAFIRMSAGSTL